MKAIKTAQNLLKPLLSKHSWRVLGNYVGIGNKQKLHAVSDIESLSGFISSRASHVAQTSLYGYLRTRAGTRFPELFENPDILKSINLAKWQVWVACVSDLSIFIGQLARQADVDPSDIVALLSDTLDQIFENAGRPDEAGDDFESTIDKTRQRIRNFTYSNTMIDDDIFSQSPEALYYWSPIAEELKECDGNIVRNSVRFRWIEVRRSCRKLLNIDTLFELSTNPSHS